MDASDNLFTAENTRLKNEISQIEKAVSERIGYLERYKAMASFKIGIIFLLVMSSGTYFSYSVF